jgi:DNA-binding transcriptional ArsR family regulator
MSQIHHGHVTTDQPIDEINVKLLKDDGIPSLRVPLAWLDELGASPSTATQLRIMLFLKKHADAFGRVSRNFINRRLSGYSCLGRGMQPCDLREHLQVKKSAISEAIKQLLNKGLLAEKRTAKRGYFWIIYPRPGAAVASDDADRPEPDDASPAQPVLPGMEDYYDPQSLPAGDRVQETAIPCGRMGERELDAAPAGGAFGHGGDSLARISHRG